MALFGKTDARVPLMTAFYQAETNREEPIGSELDILLRRYFTAPAELVTPTETQSGGVVVRSYIRQEDPHTMERWSEWRAPETAEKDLRRLGYYHPLIKVMMDHAADQTLPNVENIFAFNALIQEAMVPSVQWVPTEYSEKKKSAYPIVTYTRNILLNADESDPKPNADVNKVLGSLLETYLLAIERNAFIRCQECHSVFVSTRKQAKYCSERCRIRNSERRRREKK